jgi:diacylglycerol kinase (ATP)
MGSPFIDTHTSLPNKADRVIILRNPRAGSHNTLVDVELLAKLLRQQSFEVEVFTDLDSATRQANALFDEGRLRALVGIGGDGTAAELVNRTKEGTPLTWLPRGNCNLLARYLHLEWEPEHLAETITNGSLIHLDAGKASGRIFLLMASCGLDAEVVQRVHQRRIGHVKSRNYFKPLWNVFRTYEYPELRVYCDEAINDIAGNPTLSVCWFSVFNLPCYAGKLRFAPHALGNDGRLDLCGFRRGGFWRFMKYIGAVYLHQHQHMRDWITRRVERVRIVADVPVPFQLDGDPGGWLPLDIEVLPNRLTMIVPKKRQGCRL